SSTVRSSPPRPNARKTTYPFVSILAEDNSVHKHNHRSFRNRRHPGRPDPHDPTVQTVGLGMRLSRRDSPPPVDQEPHLAEADLEFPRRPTPARPAAPEGTPTRSADRSAPPRRRHGPAGRPPPPPRRRAPSRDAPRSAGVRARSDDERRLLTH